MTLRDHTIEQWRHILCRHKADEHQNTHVPVESSADIFDDHCGRYLAGKNLHGQLTVLGFPGTLPYRTSSNPELRYEFLKSHLIRLRQLKHALCLR